TSKRGSFVYFLVGIVILIVIVALFRIGFNLNGMSPFMFRRFGGFFFGCQAVEKGLLNIFQ
ncbi:MAG: hypothetical protein ACRC6A_07510, partial [Fusobacteriaceae bacterium]